MKRNLLKLLSIILSITMLVTFSLTGCSEQGPEGPQGEQGIQGEKGDTGAQGEKGEKGDTGAQGEKGEKGDTGAQGEKGEKGDTGVQGAKGDKGDTGATGADGKTPYIKDGNWWIGDTDTGIKAEGVDGNDGEKGDKGDTGAQGEKGDKGDTGAQGEKGDKGDTGAQGEKGDKGDTGAQGEKGDKGDTGAQGEKGDKGDTGAQGEKGDKGDTGAQGEKGDKGDPGAQGEKGDKGETGVGVKGARIEDKNGKLYLILILTDGNEVEAGYVGVAYYTVTFVDYDGTVLKTEEVEYKKGAEAPKDPEREGYAFEEWDKAFDNITGTLTVTAKYAIGLEYQLNAEETGYTIVGIGSFNGSELVIPSTFRGLPVTEIGDSAFKGKSITSVVIPDSVKNIESSAFKDCTKLANVTLGNSVTSIGDSAFYGCTSLTSIEIPDGVTSISSSTFHGCTGLTSITIPSGVTDIGTYAFYGCKGLTSVTIPANVNKIGDRAFQSCHKLIEVKNLSSKLTIATNTTENGYVGKYAQHIYTSDEEATKLFTDNGYVFYKDGDTCYLMGYTGSETALTLPANYDEKNYEIYKYAFYGNTKITSVLIPSGVTDIGTYAFYGCKGLTSVTIPANVNKIGDRAFQSCHKLIEVKNLSSKLTIATNTTENGYVGKYAQHIYTSDEEATKLFTDNGYVFYKDGDTCYLMGYTGSETALTLPANYDEKNYEIYKYAFYGNTKITSVLIPNGVTSIGDSTFYGCTGLTSVTIPNSVKSIGSLAFYSCTNLATVTLGSGITSIGNQAFSGTKYYNDESHWTEGVLYIDNYLIAADSTKFVATSYDIVSGTKVIAGYAFNGCQSLTSINIPNSVTSIGNYAFQNCGALSSIKIPDTVTSIGNYAFRDCKSLETINFSGSQTQWDDIAKGTLWDKNAGAYTLTGTYTLNCEK